MTYYVHMPTATVNGTFTVNEGVEPGRRTPWRTSRVIPTGSTVSRSTHNLWDWVDYKQFNEPGLETSLIHSCNLTVRATTARETGPPATPGQPARVPQRHRVQLHETRRHHHHRVPGLELDPEYGITYVTQEHICAVDDAGNVLDVTWTGKQHKRVYYDVPDLFEDNLTYEILSDFEGTFTPAGRHAVTIFGSGFSDWGSLLP